MSNLIFTPHEVGVAGYKAAKRAIEYGDVGIPIKISGSDIGEYIAPLLPWEAIALQAQTHNGKTFFFDWLERETAKHLSAVGQEGDIVHISHEESIEAMAFTEYGRLLDVLPARLARGEFKDLAKLEVAMQTIDRSRIWRIADSAGMDDEGEDKQSLLTLSNVERLLTGMQEGQIADKRKVRLIVDDYLQAHPIDQENSKHEDKRRLQVRADVYKIRKMAKKLISPILVGIQCKQKLEGANPPYLIPGMYDGEETSSIAQRFDRIISLWMPKNDYPVGSAQYSGSGAARERAFDVVEEMVFCKVNKQRGGLPAGKTFELRMDFAKREYVGKFGKPVGEK